MQKRERINAAVVLAAKNFATEYFKSHSFFIDYRGIIDGWVYFRIKQKGMPRYTGFGSLIRVSKKGEIDKDTYFNPIEMASRPLQDTPSNREWIAAIIRDGKRRIRKRDEFLRTHPEYQKDK